MHINEIRYLSDDDLREVFKECTKCLLAKDIKLPLSEDDVWKYIQSVDMIEAIDIEEAAIGRQNHLQATHLVDMDEKRNIPLKDGRYLRIGDLFTYEGFMEEVQEGGNVKRFWVLLLVACMMMTGAAEASSGEGVKGNE